MLQHVAKRDARSGGELEIGREDRNDAGDNEACDATAVTTGA